MLGRQTIRLISIINTNISDKIMSMFRKYKRFNVKKFSALAYMPFESVFLKCYVLTWKYKHDKSLVVYTIFSS